MPVCLVSSAWEAPSRPSNAARTANCRGVIIWISLSNMFEAHCIARYSKCRTERFKLFSCAISTEHHYDLLSENPRTLGQVPVLLTLCSEEVRARRRGARAVVPSEIGAGSCCLRF